MAKISKSKTAVKAARAAVQAAQREVLERAARNADDLAVFFSSQERLDGVDEWLETKVAALREQAEDKRVEHRRAAGAALKALRERGESVREIAQMAATSEKAIRELIRFADDRAGEDVGGPAGGAGCGAAGDSCVPGPGRAVEGGAGAPQCGSGASGEALSAAG